jgi:hypothetical protein
MGRLGLLPSSFTEVDSFLEKVAVSHYFIGTQSSPIWADG